VVDSVRQGGRDGGVRLTRRGRVVLIVAAAAVLLVTLWATAGRWAVARTHERSGAGSVEAGLETVTVGRHDTLWEIADRHRPGVDPGLTVERIIQLNGLSGAIIQPGERLRLPAR
jgi:Tfp pilus assembly protein FimV